MGFDEIQEFGKDRKKLLKEYQSLSDDLLNIKKVLAIEPDACPPFSFRNVFIEIYHKNDKVNEDRIRILKFFK